MIHRLSSDSSPFIGRDISGTVDVLGIANAAATVTVNGQSASRKGEYFQSAPAYTNASAALYPLITNTAILSGNTNTVTGQVFIAKTPETFTYDADGNQTSDGRWTNRWDGENRLITMESLANAPSCSSNRLTFTYDFMGRRVSKQVETWTNSAYSTIVSNKFVYDGWNLVAELNGTNNSAIRTYLWGMDLSGSMQGAGGVGGLLAVKDSVNATHFAAYDGNGNVTGLFSAADGTTSAVYEYDPFGNLLRATGPMAKVNPFRFSTKYQDDETDWSYYGYRFYNAMVGRWLSRDPIGELGGHNLYGFVGNSPLTKVDRLGLRDDPGPITRPCTPGCPICSPPADPPTGKPGYHDIPYWFDHPVDEGKPCCCEPAGKLKKFERTDDPPTRVKLSFKIDVQLEGCYKDLAIAWWTCWRPDGTGGDMPGFYNQTDASLDVKGITIPGIGDFSTGPHITQAFIRYLSCENGKWVKHKESKGRTYIWHDGQWTW